MSFPLQAVRSCRYLLVAAGIFSGALQAEMAVAQEMNFEVMSSEPQCASCLWIQARGEIVEASPTYLRQILERYPFIKRINIDSPGGSLGAAIEMGEEIRKRNLQTRIADGSPYLDPKQALIAREGPGECYSACVYLLAAGVIRTKVPGSSIGVHQFYGLPNSSSAAALDQSQRISGALIEYLTRMGTDPLLLSAASSADPESVVIIDDGRAFQLHLLTHPYDATRRDPLAIPPQYAADCDQDFFHYPESAKSKTTEGIKNEKAKEICETYVQVVQVSGGRHCQPLWEHDVGFISSLPDEEDRPRFLQAVNTMYSRHSSAVIELLIACALDE